ncbi:murein biosynthesis integral membrane protein MurJ [Altererythrobacter sp. SALINAS58]|uniref:murein biosynthesis integral membrane protein MurJ n=1 Tax=Alteripontixanthobacter muriae TaxID=2705546 RepID=UPI0015763771|nr:murein biosynthesis integral membrane protein MurJ [Alteripontixanthobacter muriae]NTZ43153.1 murein biosynthesis integral membrane protein MurJ [Alteripontixanthobacter muriae]
MSLVKNVGTIGGLTALSRVFGFLRDMLLARALGAGAAADAWQIAFILPNTFRRLFAEGAFSVAFVPMYSRALHGDEGGEEAAQKFTNDVLAVFIWVLLGFTAVAMVAMPGLVWLLARDFQEVPGKFELSVTLSRITFPYLALVSLVAMISGVLNARSRFAPGAFVPVLLNIVLIAAIGIGYWLRSGTEDLAITAYALAFGLFVAGVAQLAYMIWATRRAGVKLVMRRPKLSPEVKRLSYLILPATFGAGIYQISQFVDTFFATSLPQGSLTLLKFADRLNQMPLGIIGIALGTAILPMLARHIQTGDNREAQRLQSNAVEMALLLTLPGAMALAVCAEAFTTAIFLQGQMEPADVAIMANITVALVIGLPSYVLVKVFQPAFFSREDTKTPVWIAAAALAVNIAINFYVVPRYGIVGLAGATAFTATLNVATLYLILQMRGWFHWSWKLSSRILRQLVATAAMGAVLWLMMGVLAPYFGGSVLERVLSLSALILSGLIVFFGTAFAIGAIDKDLLAQLRRHKKKAGDTPISE